MVGGIRGSSASGQVGGSAPTPGVGRPAILAVVDASTWERLALAPRVVPPADPTIGHAIVLAAIRDGAIVSVALEGTLVVGLALAGPTTSTLAARCWRSGWRRSSADGVSREPSWRPASRLGVRATSITRSRSRSPSATLSSHSSGTCGHRSPGASWCVAGSIRSRSTAACGRADPSAIRAVRSTIAARGPDSPVEPNIWSKSAEGATLFAPWLRSPSSADPLAPFSPAVRDWFRASFEAPTDAQARGWAAISRGEHTLIHAPTGSGKTLAAFLWTLDRLATHPSPAPTREAPGAVRVLYISPLKALTYDIERNLRAPLTGIALAAERLGEPVPEHLGRQPDRRHPDRRPSRRSPATRRTS